MRRVRSSKCGQTERNFRFNSDRVFTSAKHNAMTPRLIPLFIYSALACLLERLDPSTSADIGNSTNAARSARNPTPVHTSRLYRNSPDHFTSCVFRSPTVVTKDAAQRPPRYANFEIGLVNNS